MDEDPGYLPPGRRAEVREMSVVDDWVAAEAGCAARLVRAAGRLGALDDQLRRGPQGWRHRLALLDAADLSWLVDDRVGLDRLASWMSLRLSGTDDDMGALARVGWAVRRLTGGPYPEVNLAAFLDRRDPENIADEAKRRKPCLGSSNLSPQKRRAVKCWRVGSPVPTKDGSHSWLRRGFML